MELGVRVAGYSNPKAALTKIGGAANTRLDCTVIFQIGRASTLTENPAHQTITIAVCLPSSRNTSMALMLVVYRTPANPEAFDRHYFEVHLPLAKKLPGLKKYEVSKGPILPIAGAKDPYIIGILHFESLAAIREAFASEIGQACAADRKLYAPNDEDLQTFLFETHEP